jgi:hypothetical protein
MFNGSKFGFRPTQYMFRLRIRNKGIPQEQEGHKIGFKQGCIVQIIFLEPADQCIVHVVTAGVGLVDYLGNVFYNSNAMIFIHGLIQQMKVHTMLPQLQIAPTMCAGIHKPPCIKSCLE